MCGRREYPRIHFDWDTLNWFIGPLFLAHYLLRMEGGWNLQVGGRGNSDRTTTEKFFFSGSWTRANRSRWASHRRLLQEMMMYGIRAWWRGTDYSPLSRRRPGKNTRTAWWVSVSLSECACFVSVTCSMPVAGNVLLWGNGSRQIRMCVPTPSDWLHLCGQLRQLLLQLQGPDVFSHTRWSSSFNTGF